MATIVVKINTAKIDKSRLFKGEKGTYLDIVLIETPDDQYGNSHMVVQSVTKEERQAGVKGAILGNAKTLGQRPQAPAPAPAAQHARPAATQSMKDDGEDIPF